MSIPLSAGGLYSTAEDLLRWEQGLFGGKLLSSASLQKMTTPFKNDYACGLAVHTVKGIKLVEHGGGIEGFNTQLSYYPEEKLTVVVLGNLNGSSPGEIASKMAALAHGEKVVLTEERKEIVVPAKILAEYVGSYELGPGFVFVVTLEGDQLITQITGQPKVPIFAESETMFFPKVVDAEIEFFRNEKGQVTRLVLHQGGRDTKALRK
jgi:hypothetical protein